MAEGYEPRPTKGAEYWLFPKGNQVDITSQLSTSGTSYTAPYDCMIQIEFYNGYCTIVGDSKNLFSTKGQWSSGSNSSQVSTLTSICKKGAKLTMWTTATINAVYLYSCE